MMYGKGADRRIMILVQNDNVTVKATYSKKHNNVYVTCVENGTEIINELFDVDDFLNYLIYKGALEVNGDIHMKTDFDIFKEAEIENEHMCRKFDGFDVKIYTDGNCHRNGGKDSVGAIGVYTVFACGKEDRYGQAFDNTTNNKMEILAVVRGLSAITDKSLKVQILSDSKYVIDCMNDKWYENWENNGWKNSKKEPVANESAWKKLLFEIEQFETPVDFKWVKGHTGKDDGNSVADELATISINRHR